MKLILWLIVIVQLILKLINWKNVNASESATDYETEILIDRATDNTTHGHSVADSATDSTTDSAFYIAPYGIT